MITPHFRHLPLQLRPLVDKFYRDHRSPMRSQTGDELWVAQSASQIVAALSLRPLAGGQWLALQAAMDERAPFVPTLQACAPFAQALRIPLRNLLHYHGGVRVFRTRQLLLDVQAISRRRSPATSPTTDP